MRALCAALLALAVAVIVRSGMCARGLWDEPETGMFV